MDKQELLRKYWNGTCSPAELRRLYHHLQADQANDYEPLLSQLWAQLSDTRSLDPPASARIYQNIVSATQGLDVPKRSRWYWPRAAAAMGILLIAAYLISYLAFPKYTTYQTAFGEIEQITLPDGTQVDLNANSELRIAAAGAEGQPREVWFSGEAYFHVEPQQTGNGKAVRFIVHTSSIDVEVTGTAFNVKDRRGTTDVVLNSGSVLLREPDRSEVIAMKPGERVRFTSGRAFVRTEVLKPEAYSSWKEYELYFEDQTLAAIRQELADTYDISVRFGDPSLGELRFTGSAPTGNPTILLKTIQKSFNLTLKHDDNGYFLTQ